MFHFWLNTFFINHGVVDDISISHTPYRPPVTSSASSVSCVGAVTSGDSISLSHSRVQNCASLSSVASSSRATSSQYLPRHAEGDSLDSER